MPEKNAQPNGAVKKPSKSIVAQVADRIKDSDNVLVALSKNPSVDELSAALGFTFMLDKLGKHATAIFSGAVPNAIEFLEPEKTFESNTNSLQDFIIALDKEKADHLRYKIEGDFVKVFITPYKTTLDEKDLEFSHGDYNVDLIVALNVEAESDLDSALSEYGKIKHDASSINISAAVPGKFGDLEWGDPAASSVSEMIATLADILDAEDAEEKLVDKSTATALLAGIVAATNRFSNERTSADTMSVAAALMSNGADQQLISSSIPVDILTNDTVDVNEEVAELDKEESVEAPKEKEKKEEAPEEELVIEKEAEPVVEEAPEAEPEPIVEEEAPEEQKEESAAELAIERMNASIRAAEGKTAVDEELREIEELSAKKPDNVPDLPASESSPIEPANEDPTAPEDAPEIETIAVPAPAEAAPVDLPTPELEPLAEPAIAPEEQPVGISGDAPAPAPVPLPTPEPLPEENISEPNPHPNSAAVNNEKSLIPPSEAALPPKENIDYAAQMEQELQNAVPAPVMAPTELPTAEMAPIAAPVMPVEPLVPDDAEPVISEPMMNESMQASAATPPTAAFQPAPNVDPALPPVAPAGVPASAEYVNPPLPMPDDGSILPPPPIPFALDEAMPMPPTAAPAPAPVAAPVEAVAPQPAPAPSAPVAQPSAQEFVQGVQADMQAAAAQAPVEAPIEPIMPAVFQEEDNTLAVSPAVNGVNPVMQDQVYADPAAFHIPGM